MFARLTARAILVFVAIAMAFFGVGLLGMALATALAAALGTPGAYALAGGLLLIPPLLWALTIHFAPSKRPAAAPPGELVRLLLGAAARETPWAAVIGAALASAANLFLNRNKSPK
ncbi:MAG TPA: hypothetical protein VHC40_14560 [Rhizomicrobium sp.]|jgi:hypothetical protein|nr:hypothetical protein [Rhizomicrobium sp.]